jgi:hypothetical protein
MASLGTGLHAMQEVTLADNAYESFLAGAALIPFSRNSSAMSFTVVEGFTVITGATMMSRTSKANLPH